MIDEPLAQWSGSVPVTLSLFWGLRSLVWPLYSLLLPYLRVRSASVLTPSCRLGLEREGSGLTVTSVGVFSSRSGWASWLLDDVGVWGYQPPQDPKGILDLGGGSASAPSCASAGNEPALVTPGFGFVQISRVMITPASETFFGPGCLELLAFHHGPSAGWWELGL